MAYSKNIISIVIGLGGQGHSAEQIAFLFSKLREDEKGGFTHLCEVGLTFSVQVTRADWLQLQDDCPDPKTFRRWLQKQMPETEVSVPLPKSPSPQACSDHEGSRTGTPPAGNLSPNEEPETAEPEPSRTDNPPAVTEGKSPECPQGKPCTEPSEPIEIPLAEQEGWETVYSQKSAVQADAEEEPFPTALLDSSDASAANETGEAGQTSQPGTVHIGDPCQAPPDKMNVLILERQWKVPAEKAPGILAQWISWHSQGKHQMCRLFPRLAEFIRDEIPYDVAEGLLQGYLGAEEFHNEKLVEELDMTLRIRPWQGTKNREASMKIHQELNKPSPARQQHLNEISFLLRRFEKEAETAASSKQWDMTLEIEDDEQFPDLMRHCRDVAWYFGLLRQDKFECERTMQELTLRIAREGSSRA